MHSQPAMHPQQVQVPYYQQPHMHVHQQIPPNSTFVVPVSQITTRSQTQAAK